MLDNAAVIVYIASLVIDLGANYGSLVIDLIATVGVIDLIKPGIQPLITAIALICANVGDGCISAAIVSLQELVILLYANIFTLATYRVTPIAAAILIKTIIFSLIAIISLIIAYGKSVD